MTSIPTPVPSGRGAAPAAVRLPDATQVGGVRLQVSDLDRSIAYYRDVVGLQLTGPPTVDTAALGVPASEAPLVTLQAMAGTVPVRRRGAFGLFHFAIRLPTRAALGRFLAHLADLDVRAGMSDHLVSEAVYLSDPDGLGIEVYADRARDTWRYADDQLQMATDPLDVAALATAAGGEPWTGVPAATVMGHIHLHVGDLAVADAFYRQQVGFDITTWSYPGALFFSAGGYHHHLGANTWAPGPAPRPEQAQMLEWALVLPCAADVEAIATRADDRGAPVISDGADRWLSDPWGTRLRLTAVPSTAI